MISDLHGLELGASAEVNSNPVLFRVKPTERRPTRIRSPNNWVNGKPLFGGYKGSGFGWLKGCFVGGGCYDWNFSCEKNLRVYFF